MQEVKRLEDPRPRALALRQSNELTLATLKAGYEREIAAMRSANDVALGSTKATLMCRSTRSTRNQAPRARPGRAAPRQPRARRSQGEGHRGPAYRDEEIEEAFATVTRMSSTMDKVMAAAPAFIEQVGKVIASEQAGAAPAAVQAQAVPPGPPEIYRGANGQPVILQGGKAIPIVRKPNVVKTDDGPPVVAPVVEPNQVVMRRLPRRGLQEMARSPYRCAVVPAMSRKRS